MSKDKWQEKWTKIKQFVRKKQSGARDEKDDVFSAILALYAGEEDVFSELNALYDRHPQEVEFYVPQLCTYLFHFEVQSQRGLVQSSSRHHKLLEDFLLLKAKGSVNFAHLLFWYIIAGIDDSESIQLSQHKHPTVW